MKARHCHGHAGDGPFAPQPVEELPETPETPSKKSFEELRNAEKEAPSRRKRGPEDFDWAELDLLRNRCSTRPGNSTCAIFPCDDWEMQARKKLENFRRRARFELELVADELKEKRYSQQGHKVHSLGIDHIREADMVWIAEEAAPTSTTRTDGNLFGSIRLTRRAIKAGGFWDIDEELAAALSWQTAVSHGVLLYMMWADVGRSGLLERRLLLQG
eukprot:Skav219877  [mRNA]  locus=scaffold777:277824:282269:+ [translate_table: standard]